MTRTSRRKKDSLVASLLDKGLVRYALGKREEAIEFWQQALEQAPTSSRARDYLQSIGAITPSELDELGASTGDLAPVMESEALRHPATDSLVPPFTKELPSYDPDEDDQDVDSDELDMEPVVPDVEILLGNAREEEAAGQLEKALKYADEALKREPDHAEVQALSTDLRKRLSDIYRAELEPLESVPFLRATDASILELSLDPIGGFLISQIDGEITVEELLTILGTFDEFRVLSSLHFFLENGIIELRS
jgi:tetratricopeptide (TPR) repeat protein